ncbi:MAG: orotidine-5'-phosphate decarboxylase [Alphaproteobacteria bacterium]|nr:orotidine-5'-phosphate decarboxylase [Alphaproteobacteria bacterium]MCL2889990.1 orotidine-5'-phosphate decarboxylase [Alphaproteobacteria bacterium]
MHAFQKLAQQIKTKNSRLVLGLDPSPEQMDYKKLRKIIDKCAPHIVGIKLNLAFYEKHSRHILAEIMNYTAIAHPNLLRILDDKRGDIGSTQKEYSTADIYNFVPDIVTVSPYIGEIDTIMPYLDADPNMCVFALAATSNENAKIQNLRAEDGLYVYQHMALEIRNVDKERVGFVVGATKPESMKNIRTAELDNGHDTKDLAFVLAPGFGRQGGDLDFIKYAGPNAIYPISSGLTNPEYLGKMKPAKAAEKWKNDINNAAADGYKYFRSKPR